jgi:hypothetical protein
MSSFFLDLFNVLMFPLLDRNGPENYNVPTMFFAGVCFE